MNDSATAVMPTPALESNPRAAANVHKQMHPQPLETASEQGRRIQDLVGKIETVADPNARMLAQECIQAILEFYGGGLERILYLVEDAESGTRSAFDTLTNDSVVSGLLLIHSLHPIPLETRLLKALAKVRPYMRSHGGNVELISLDQGRAKLRLVGACDSCASSAVTLELALRQSIEEACPDLAEFEVEGRTAQDSPERAGTPSTTPEWILISEISGLQNRTFISIKTAKVPLVICRLDDQFYAYRDQCPTCNVPLHLGAMEKESFRCAQGHIFDIRAAGRCIENPRIHLDPFPLMAGDDGIRISVG